MIRDAKQATMCSLKCRHWEFTAIISNVAYNVGSITSKPWKHHMNWKRASWTQIRKHNCDNVLFKRWKESSPDWATFRQKTVGFQQAFLWVTISFFVITRLQPTHACLQKWQSQYLRYLFIFSAWNWTNNLKFAKYLPSLKPSIFILFTPLHYAASFF